MKPKISISISIVLLAIMFAMFGSATLVINYLLALTFHEVGHLIAIYRCGYNVKSFSLSLAGARIKLGDTLFYRDEFEVAVAGPATNVVLAIVCVAGWWFWPESYAYTRQFAQLNYFLAAFNMLPINNLDGGQILESMLSSRCTTPTIEKVKKYFAIAFSIVFFIFFALNCTKIIGFCYFLLSLFFILGTISAPKNIILTTFLVRKNKPQRMQIIYLPEDSALVDAIKYLSPRYITIFYYNGKMIHERQIIDRFKMGKI